MKTILCLILYYGIARFLPKSTFKFGGKTSKYIRHMLCKNIFEFCGNNVNVERMAWFGRGTKIKIGDNSGIGVNCKIHNNTIIGENVMMGPKCYFLKSGHKFERTDITLRAQGKVSESVNVVIEDDVWIGREVMIMGSKTIKKGSIIAARCVLTKNFPDYSIIGGNPSKLIRSRV